MKLEKLLTEGRNPSTLQIDQLSALDIAVAINREDALVAAAVGQVLPAIAQAIDWIVASIQQGGRLFYLGAGTSGRLGILDASECPPTYGTPPDMIQGLIAGGNQSVFRSVEGAEDSPVLAAEDLVKRRLKSVDIVVGVAASGRTPYVMGGLDYASSIGCRTVALTCAPGSDMEQKAALTICVQAGPEVIMGSTRMKAGTAQKMVLNMLSTGAMIRLGKVYSNLMVDVQASNKKLVDRARRIVMLAAGVAGNEAEAALIEAGGSVKVAVTMLRGHLSAAAARTALTKHQGFVSRVLQENAPKD